MEERPVFAHSLSNAGMAEWELLAEHLKAVGASAGERAAAFGFRAAATAGGQLHDIGKASEPFQTYIGARGDARAGSVDHSTAGAREAVRLYPGAIGRALAYAIAGHHAGLADGVRLGERLAAPPDAIPDYSGWRAHAEPPSAADLALCARRPSRGRRSKRP